MIKGFSRLVCENPPSDSDLREWLPDLSDEHVGILHQIFRDEFVPDATCDDETIFGIDALLLILSRILTSSTYYNVMQYRDYRVDAVSLEHLNKSIKVCSYKYMYTIELEN